MEAMGITKIVTVIIVRGVTPSYIQGDGGGGEGASVTCSYNFFGRLLCFSYM